MERRGITKYAFCKKYGIPYTTLENIILGKTKMEDVRAGTLLKIAGSFGYSIETLLKHPVITMDQMTGNSEKYQIPYLLEFRDGEYRVHFQYAGKEYTRDILYIRNEEPKYLEPYQVFISMDIDKIVEEADLDASIQEILSDASE